MARTANDDRRPTIAEDFGRFGHGTELRICDHGRHNPPASDIQTSAFFVLERERSVARMKFSSRKEGTVMRSSLKVVTTGFGLSIVLLSFAPVASAEPKEDVAAATSAWGALGEDEV
jgi:hypothetical protein